MYQDSRHIAHTASCHREKVGRSHLICPGIVRIPHAPAGERRVGPFLEAVEELPRIDNSG